MDHSSYRFLNNHRQPRDAAGMRYITIITPVISSEAPRLRHRFMQSAISILFLILAIMFPWVAKAQDTLMANPAQDTLTGPGIEFTPESASDYIGRLIGDKELWKNQDDTLKNSLIRLLNQYNIPFDTTRSHLEKFNFDALSYDTILLTRRDTLPLRWLNDSLLFVDTIPLEQSPVLTQKTIIMKTVEPDSTTRILMDSIPGLANWIDSLITVKDTVTETRIDYLYLQNKNVSLHRLINGKISPQFVPRASNLSAQISGDSSTVIISKYRLALLGSSGSPFNLLPGGHTADSLQKAVTTLLNHTWERDSIMLNIRNIQGKKTPFWLTAHKSELYRYWLKNSENDSITVWLGNPRKFDLTMILEEKVNVERMGLMPSDNIMFISLLPDKTPVEVKPLHEIPVFWDYGFNGSFSLNQNYITYWAQGGESSFAGLLDLNGRAKYTNKANETDWENSARLRFGSVRTNGKGLQINTDIIEINSQYNKKMTKNLDFSSVFYFKTQLAKGYNYPNDSVPVSKFLNPGTFTIGVGGEYKPFSHTLLNLSPLSYKNTFVLDTAQIDQTAHGIDEGMRSKQEIGGQLVIKNNFSVLDDVKITNSLRLFSNYADKPQNVDVDWESSIEKQIAWIFSVKLNIHLIYDDDIRFPVKLPDGEEKKVPRTQFNQFLGLSVSLNL